MQNAVEMRGVSKNYGDREALRRIDLEIEQRSITALLGPNGAGKSTLMEIMSGLRSRDAGDISVLGADPRRSHQFITENVGVQVQEFNLQNTVQVEEVLRFFASLYKKPMDVATLLQQFGLQDKRKSKFPSLSGGQKRRLAIARALVGDPQLVILDEPTSGLDPQGQAFLRRETKRLREEGRTVLLSTHNVADAQELADKVVIIDSGRVVASGTPTEIISAHCGTTRLLLSAPQSVIDNAGLSNSLIKGDAENEWIYYGEMHAATKFAQAGIEKVEERTPTLHDAFIRLTGSDLRS